MSEVEDPFSSTPRPSFLGLKKKRKEGMSMLTDEDMKSVLREVIIKSIIKLKAENNRLREELAERQEAIAAVIRGAAKSGNLTANALRLCKKAIRCGEAALEGK